jgi:glucose/arabinose dehydrogenase
VTPYRLGALLVALVLLATACTPADEAQTPEVVPGPTPDSEAEPADADDGEVVDPPEPTAPVERQEDEDAEDVSVDDVQLRFETAAEGFDQPIEVTAPVGDDRLFVLERAGRVWVLDGQDAELFLDVSDQTRVRSEEGLLGVAFHPGFADTGRFVVHHTDTGGDNRVAEYRLADDGRTADPGSRRELLHVEQPASNHNGGMVAFGPDEMLYVAIGDGGGSGDEFGHGQRADTLLGTILRLDPDAEDGVPGDNPFVGGSVGAPEVWHYGLRNPWRFSFDDDELYIADVGQNRFEEVNVVPADEGGLNFGWPIMEASHCFEPAADCPTEGLVHPSTSTASAVSPSARSSAGSCTEVGHPRPQRPLPLHRLLQRGDPQLPPRRRRGRRPPRLDRADWHGLHAIFLGARRRG